MNIGLINGFLLNGPTVKGNNALLAGGIVVASIFSSTAAISASVILKGGMSANTIGSGQITNSLFGGLSSNSYLTADWFITTVLRDGIKVDPVLHSRLNQSPSLRYGVHTVGDVGGQLVSSPKLQNPSNVGSLAFVGGTVLRDTNLNFGVHSYAVAGGNLVGGLVLMNGGLVSTAKVGGSNREMGGFSMRDGISNTVSIGGKQFITGILSGGFITTPEVGKEIDVEAILTGGTLLVGVTGSPPMQLSPRLNNGVGAYTFMDSTLILSPNSNGGLFKDDTFNANQIITARLQGGVGSTITLDSKSMRAAQTLLDGLSSGTLFGARYIINDRLPGGVATTATLSGKYHINGYLQGNVSKNSVVEGKLRIDYIGNSGVQSTTALAGDLRAQVLLKGNFAVTDELGGGIRTAIFLRGGLSSVVLADGDISQGFLDPLINSKWLEMFSATEKLEIFTPIEDI